MVLRVNPEGKSTVQDIIRSTAENTCVLVPPHGGAGRLFRDFLFLPVGHRAKVSGKNEQMESVGTVTGNGGGLGFA